MPNAGYVLGTNPSEQLRLEQQSADLASRSSWLLDQIGILPGWRVVDVGCGPSGDLEQLAIRVGPSGAVIGLEQNEEHAALARSFAERRKLGVVTVINGDVVGNKLPAESFDLAHERLVLVNVPGPEAVLAAMVRLVRPGGVVACHDSDQYARVCDPPHPAWNRLTELLFDAYRRSGADPFVGRRLPSMMKRAGLEDIRVNIYADVSYVDHSRRFTLLKFIDDVRAAILVGGDIHADDLDDAIEALKLHLADPETTVVSGLYYQIWGRKPG